MIPIKNIYYMLSYAFKVLKEKGYAELGSESFDNTPSLLSAILVKGISVQIKRGLLRSYNSHTDAMSCVKGKVDITESVKHNTMLNKQLICTYDNFTINSYPNRILKTTMKILIGSDIPKEQKKALRKLLLYFSGVEELNRRDINWKIKYNKNNQSYMMLITICYLIINDLLQNEDDGTFKLMDYFDEQKMSRLYEKFILEYYRTEYPGIASSPQIKWAVDDDFTFMLPTMQTDIMLEKDNNILIIDAKYYNHTTQQYYNKNTVHSANLYQIFTYVKNKAVEGKNVSGMLLYAKTDENTQPDEDYLMNGNKISVKTLDLNCDFEKIREQLDDIAKNFYR